MPQTAPIALSMRDILKLLPHRYPFLLVDRVTELVPNDYVKGYKNLTMDESFFQGHFPDAPVMPGVLIIEAMAQVGVLLVVKSVPELENNSNQLYMFTGIEKARFRKPVFPGDRLDIVCDNLRHKMALWKMDAKAYVDGKLVAEGILTATGTPRDTF